MMFLAISGDEFNLIGTSFFLVFFSSSFLCFTLFLLSLYRTAIFLSIFENRSTHRTFLSFSFIRSFISRFLFLSNPENVFLLCFSFLLAHMMLLISIVWSVWHWNFYLLAFRLWLDLYSNRFKTETWQIYCEKKRKKHISWLICQISELSNSKKHSLTLSYRIVLMLSLFFLKKNLRKQKCFRVHRWC